MVTGTTPLRRPPARCTIDDGMRYVVKAPRIDRNTGAIYVVTDQGRVDYQNGATVARESH